MTNNFWKFEVANVKKSFPILKFTEVTIRILSIFWSIFDLNDVKKRFRDATTLT